MLRKLYGRGIHSFTALLLAGGKEKDRAVGLQVWYGRTYMRCSVSSKALMRAESVSCLRSVWYFLTDECGLNGCEPYSSLVNPGVDKDCTYRDIDMP